jgi:hypothetical protein
VCRLEKKQQEAEIRIHNRTTQNHVILIIKSQTIKPSSILVVRLKQKRKENNGANAITWPTIAEISAALLSPNSQATTDERAWNNVPRACAAEGLRVVRWREGPTNGFVRRKYCSWLVPIQAACEEEVGMIARVQQWLK